ncbi:hypothetical protein AB0C47_34860 [Micromonospora taraxaci]|uniref:hypothetical protein n=1 Tax=Micromonospora taraxaci TaxID=1316803 RepID=UPI0033C54579
MRKQISRPVTQAFVALAIALVAGVAFVLGMAAMLGLAWDPRGSVIVAIAAVWIPQTLIAAARHRRN